jgi:hypothetical protein
MFNGIEWMNLGKFFFPRADDVAAGWMLPREDRPPVKTAASMYRPDLNDNGRRVPKGCGEQARRKEDTGSFIQ